MGKGPRADSVPFGMVHWVAERKQKRGVVRVRSVRLFYVFVVSFQVKFVGYGGFFFILYILWLRCRNG